jgi:hypothetical protein
MLTAPGHLILLLVHISLILTAHCSDFLILRHWYWLWIVPFFLSWSKHWYWLHIAPFFWFWHTGIDCGLYHYWSWLTEFEIQLTADMTGHRGMLLLGNWFYFCIYRESLWPTFNCLLLYGTWSHHWYIQRSVYAHSLICISYKTYEIDYWSLFLSFHLSIQITFLDFYRMITRTGFSDNLNNAR